MRLTFVVSATTYVAKSLHYNALRASTAATTERFDDSRLSKFCTSLVEKEIGSYSILCIVYSAFAVQLSIVTYKPPVESGLSMQG